MCDKNNLCPECGHLVGEHDLRDNYCHHVVYEGGEPRQCGKCTPADLQPSPFVHESLMRQATEMEEKRYEPEPAEMPLIDLSWTYDSEKLTDAFNNGRNLQRDADMALLPAHDQQVRKEFAEKVIKVLPYITQGEVDHIRAMAEGGAMKDKSWCCDCKYHKANLPFDKHGICKLLNIGVSSYRYRRVEGKICSNFIRKALEDCPIERSRFADCNNETCLQ